MSSISRASAAATRAVNTLGRPSRLVSPSWSVTSRPISSRTLSQTRMEILELEKWRQSKLEKMSVVDKTIAPIATTTTAAKTIPGTNIHNPDALSTTSAQTTTTDSKKKTDRAPVAPVTTTTTNNNKKKPADPNITTNSPPSPTRLSPGPPYDPLDPDNNMGVDHTAWLRRQLPLFLGGGPFF